MRAFEMEQVICNGENSGIAYALEDAPVQQIARDAAAMANLKGGCILLGVSPDGRASGVHREGVKDWITNDVFSRGIRPALAPSYAEAVLASNTRVGIVTVAEGVCKPYAFRVGNEWEVPIRMGRHSRRATGELKNYIRETVSNARGDLLPVSGAGLDALDRQRATDYLLHITRDAVTPESEADWCRRLISLGFMTEGPGHVPVCTIVGILIFGQAPRRYLRQAGIRLMIFDGLAKTYDARYDKVLDGPILSLWTTSGEGGRVLSGDGLLDTVDAVLKPFIVDEKNEVVKGFRRNTGPRFSREVIREVLVNAVAHRDWTRFTEIEIVVYADRMEVTSPGPLPNTMTIEKMIAGQRSPRNPILVDVLRDYGYVDARGMGIRNKVIPLVRAMCGVDPAFEETDDYLRTILPTAKEGARKE